MIAVGALALAPLVLIDELRPRGIFESVIAAASILVLVAGHYTRRRWHGPISTI